LKTHKDNISAKKIRELISELEKASFVNRGGKGSHRNFLHLVILKSVVISGKAGDDAKKYQERAVEAAINEVKK
jgi:predicted RNA binding protein YcfA (HicA-like mRNA interferase family)